jgi:hypothetical protein
MIPVASLERHTVLFSSKVCLFCLFRQWFSAFCFMRSSSYFVKNSSPNIMKKTKLKIITFLDIIHRPVFIQKHNFWETGFCLPIFRWNLLSWAQSIGPVPIGPSVGFLPEDRDKIQSPKSCVLSKNRTMDNVQKRNIFINLLSSQNSDLKKKPLCFQESIFTLTYV